MRERGLRKKTVVYAEREAEPSGKVRRLTSTAANLHRSWADDDWSRRGTKARKDAL